MKDTQAAWFAGVLDSDGHIGIYRNVGNTQRHKNPRYAPALVITNTNEALLNRLSSLWPESKLKLRPRASERHQQTYSWQCLTIDSIVRLLQELRPYLIAKAAQADLLMDFLFTRKRTVSMGTGTTTPVEEMDFREACWRRIRALNSPLSTRND